jgi:hypothetical protein
MHLIRMMCGVLLLVGASRLTAAEAFDQSHARLGGLLAAHVNEAMVDYAGLKANPAELDAYLEEVAAVRPEEFNSWTEEEQLALLLNLYNAHTLRLIINHYPLKSIRSIGTLPLAAWRIRDVRFGGNLMTLDHLENKMIRVDYDEPRIHFALVCAAMGCPPLRAEPYVGIRLSEQLDDQTRTFLGDASKNRFEADSGILRISPIFKWYKEDFTEAAGSLEAYVRPFLPEASRKALGQADRVRVKYTDYDWALNEWTR